MLLTPVYLIPNFVNAYEQETQSQSHQAQQPINISGYQRSAQQYNSSQPINITGVVRTNQNNEGRGRQGVSNQRQFITQNKSVQVSQVNRIAFELSEAKREIDRYSSRNGISAPEKVFREIDRLTTLLVAEKKRVAAIEAENKAQKALDAHKKKVEAKIISYLDRAFKEAENHSRSLRVERALSFAIAERADDSSNEVKRDASYFLHGLYSTVAMDYPDGFATAGARFYAAIKFVAFAAEKRGFSWLSELMRTDKGVPMSRP